MRRLFQAEEARGFRPETCLFHPNVLDKHNEPVDLETFAKIVRNILSVPASKFPSVEELERRPTRGRPRKDA